MPDTGGDLEALDDAARKIIDVVNSTLDAAAGKDEPRDFLFLLGLSMGASAHLAYDVMGVHRYSGPGSLFERFHEGFDSGIKTAEGVITVFDDIEAERG